MKKIFFSGYAPVHFLSFAPIYADLRYDPDFEVVLSGGFRHKSPDGEVSFSSEGFYDSLDVDPAHVVPVEEAQSIEADVVVCSHLSDSLLPKSAKHTVQLFHGVSFKNYAVREKALSFDFLCMPGPYHVRKYRERGLIRPDSSRLMMTGFAKMDALVDGSLDRTRLLEKHGLDPDKKTLLYAPTGDKNNSLETIGKKVIKRLARKTEWNLLIKPHDHPKKKINWFERLAPYESDTVRLLRDNDVVPWLHAADLLISDASSVITEFTLLDRPIVLLNVPQLLERVLVRGGALDLETYGHNLGPVVDDPSTISKVIRAQLKDSSRYQEVRQAMAADVFHDPGSASKRALAVIKYAATGDDAYIRDIERITA